MSANSNLNAQRKAVGVKDSRSLVVRPRVVQLDKRAAEHEGPVEIGEVLDQLGAVLNLGLLGRLDEAVVYVLVVPEMVLVGDVAVIVAGRVDARRLEHLDDLACGANVVAVGVSANVEVQVSWPDANLPQVRDDLVLDPAANDGAFPQRIALIRAVRVGVVFSRVNDAKAPIALHHDSLCVVEGQHMNLGLKRQGQGLGGQHERADKHDRKDKQTGKRRPSAHWSMRH